MVTLDSTYGSLLVGLVVGSVYVTIGIPAIEVYAELTIRLYGATVIQT